jgi:predicted GIY-YIG superfamily endonuclease
MIGVYSITNTVNKKKYFGSSRNISSRISEHKTKLKSNKHINGHLQNSWNKYGEENFVFEIIEEFLTIEDALFLEQELLNKSDLKTTFNINKNATRPNVKSLIYDELGNPNILFPKVGDRYAQLQVISIELKQIGNHKKILCLCDCGKTKYIAPYLLVTKECVSCGCKTSHLFKKKHGQTNTPEFRAWSKIIEWCYNPNTKSYKHYGGKGITVCETWKNNFESFLADMGHKPLNTDCLGRKNTSDNFCKENCEWSTYKKQNNRRKDTIYIEYNKEIKPLRYWADKYSILPATLWARLKKGWSIDRAFNEKAFIGKNQKYAKK